MLIHMQFKEPEYENQFNKLPAKLKEIANLFSDYCNNNLTVNPTVTRVWDKVEGESGVHTCHRAIDFRDVTFNRRNNLVRTFSDREVTVLLEYINIRYPRVDKKKTMIYHSFQGGPHHFHIQIPFEWLTKEEKENELARFPKE